MTTSVPTAGLRQNRLAREQSPYLLQHQYNPVDWYAWGPEAFSKARREQKPIFLSIGYSTCHWCHVMERESFENPEVAAFLNEHFVSVKVDREERPDLDKIYMTFVQATTGQGGWPLTAFLDGELRPFYGGTYFPPDNRHGRPGLLQLLNQIQQLWQTRRADLEQSAAQMHARLVEAMDREDSGELPLTEKLLQNAAAVFKHAYDAEHGGFGGAPKFPQPSQPQFLLRYGARFGDADAIRMVLHTCDRMAAGGIHDQLGGGFARYSVDARWLVPHFEKMLYDNAQLAQLYLDAYLISGDERHAVVVRDILDYVLRDMAHPEGGFYSAEDADSEGQEGKFYCWTLEELTRLLSPEELRIAERYYGLTPQGNFVDHSHPDPLRGLNVLSVVDPNVTSEEKDLLEAAKTKMRSARALRVRPHLDDKVLSSWNGLMLGAFARAGVVLREPRYLEAAEQNATFIRKGLWDADTGRLFHRWRGGERDAVQLLEAYAFLLSGVLDLYEATLAPQHLEWACALADSMLAGFEDRQQGGFWQSATDDDQLILRIKVDQDGAEPSGNSVAALSLLRVGKITANDNYTEAGRRVLRHLSDRLGQFPQAVPYLLQALDFQLVEPCRALLVGPVASAPVNELLPAVHGVYQPNKVVLGTRGRVDPFARSLESQERKGLYLCTGTACQEPTDDPAKAMALVGTPQFELKLATRGDGVREVE